MSEEIDPAADAWHVVGKIFIFFLFAAFVLFCTVMFLTGFFVWGLLWGQ